MLFPTRLAPRFIEGATLTTQSYPDFLRVAIQYLVDRVDEELKSQEDKIQQAVLAGTSINVIKKEWLTFTADLWIDERDQQLPDLDILLHAASSPLIGATLLSYALADRHFEASTITLASVINAVIDRFVLSHVTRWLSKRVEALVARFGGHNAGVASLTRDSYDFYFDPSPYIIVRESAAGWQDLPSERRQPTDVELHRQQAVQLPFGAGSAPAAKQMAKLTLEQLTVLTSKCLDDDGCTPSELLTLAKKTPPNLDAVDENTLTGIVQSENKLALLNIKSRLVGLYAVGMIYDAFQAAVEVGIMYNFNAILTYESKLSDIPGKGAKRYLIHFGRQPSVLPEDITTPPSASTPRSPDSSKTVPV